MVSSIPNTKNNIVLTNYFYLTIVIYLDYGLKYLIINF